MSEHAVEAPQQQAVPTGATRTGPVGGGAAADLQRQAGNQAVARLLAGSQGATGAPVGDDRELVQMALSSRSALIAGMIGNFAAATVDERIQLAGILVDQFWVGPGAESALESLWNSFGATLHEIVAANAALWKRCLDAGMDPSGIAVVAGLRRAFETDVRGIANRYIASNLQFVDSELAQLGLTTPSAAVSPTRQTEVELHREAMRDLAEQATNALVAQDRLRQIRVGYRRHEIRDYREGYDEVLVPMGFDPQRRPDSDTGEYGAPAPSHTWDQVKQRWDDTGSVLEAIGARSPTVYAAVVSGDRSNLTSLTGDDPAAAMATARRLLTSTRTNIVATIPKIDSGDLDWRDLRPIHDALYAGGPAPSGVNWSGELAKTVAQDVIGDHETREFWISLGLGTLAAAAFIIAEFATGGLATALLVGGIAASGAQAVRSWENWEDLSTAAGASASSRTELVAQGQADAALLSAVLDTVFAFIDIAAPFVKAARAGAVAAELEAQVAARGAAAALTNLPEGAAGVAAIERAITEIGAEATIARSGKTAEQLLAMLPEGSAARARVIEAAARSSAAPTAGALARFSLTEAETAWAAGRTVEQLIAEVPQATLRGTLRRETADALLAEAIDTLGPRAVIERCGGWRPISQALGRTESVAGTRLMAWRDSVFNDLEAYVRDVLRGDVQRTGTVSNVTNDIDMSFVGPRASEVKQAASEYFARRLGIANSSADFDRVMMAGLFTDPRRMHAYDVLPEAVRTRIAAEQAVKEEGLIWNHRLYHAVHEGDQALADSIREQMRSLGVREFPYRPLSPDDVRRLYLRQDRLHAELMAATDLVEQERLATQLGETQAMINATENGGYFSGGGVRRYVTERPGEAGFMPLAGGTRQAVPASERLTAILDQLDKLDHSLLELGHGGAQAVPGIRGIGKYGGRLREVLGEAGRVVPDDAVWKRLADNCKRLKDTADDAAAMARMSAAEMDTLVRDARTAFGELSSASADLVAQVRQGAQLPELAARATERLQDATRAHARLLAAIDAAMANIHALIDAARHATEPISADPGQTADRGPIADRGPRVGSGR